MLRNPSSIPAGDTVVEDASLEPFFITNSKTSGYTVYEKVTRGKDNRQYLRTVGYPATFNNALRVVAREKLNAGDGQKYNTLSEYVTKWEAIANSISNATKMTL